MVHITIYAIRSLWKSAAG